MMFIFVECIKLNSEGRGASALFEEGKDKYTLK